MSDPVDEHLDKAIASLDDVPVRELMATSEALGRQKDGLRNFASIFRNVADARGQSWGTDIPSFHFGRTSPAPTRGSPRRSRRRKHPSGAMCAMRWPSGIPNPRRLLRLPNGADENRDGFSKALNELFSGGILS